MDSAKPSSPGPDQFRRDKDAVARAFGAENRSRLLDRYFLRAGAVTSSNAWIHVYRLLLWVDRTTALAHCYESDKAQPGRVWYARSLAFHDWIAKNFRISPADLGEHIDWLFKEAIKDLTSRIFTSRGEAYRKQRAPYDGRGFPEPGEDPELISLVKEALKNWVKEDPPEQEFRLLAKQIHAYLTQENKRRNLVGEGFEDVVAAILNRLPLSERIESKNRSPLHELPGFYPPPPNEKVKKVDLALIESDRRILVSVKWSIRADREEQFQSDFETYARLESAGRDFEYVLITNEFDAARLRAACERRRQNAPLFTQVVHINPDGILAAYGGAGRGSATVVRDYVEAGRLTSLANWLAEL